MRRKPFSEKSIARSQSTPLLMDLNMISTSFDPMSNSSPHGSMIRNSEGLPDIFIFTFIFSPLFQNVFKDLRSIHGGLIYKFASIRSNCLDCLLVKFLPSANGVF